MEKVHINKISSKRVYRNEWHLLCFILEHINNVQKLSFKIIKNIPCQMRLPDHLGGLKHRNHFFILDEGEMGNVLNILEKEYEVEAYMEKGRIICFYNKENVPKVKKKLPF